MSLKRYLPRSPAGQRQHAPRAVATPSDGVEPDRRDFRQRLEDLEHAPVEVMTTCGHLSGSIREVHEDYFVVETGQGPHRVRTAQVCWVRPTSG